MTFQQLNYLVEISKCGSINKAAQKLFLSQSGISIAIKELEEELGITFFLRTNRGVTFTPEGREFLNHAVSLLDSKRQLEQLYGNNKEKAASAYLSVSSQRYPFVEEAFLMFLKAHEGDSYRLELQETGMDAVIEDVYDRKADIGVIFLSELTEKIISRMLASRDLTFHEVCSVEPRVYVRKGHPLAGKSKITENDLIGYPFVTFVQSQGVASDFSEEVQLFPLNQTAQRIVINSRSTALDILAESDAVTTGTGLLVKGISRDDIISIPIEGLPAIRLGWIHLDSVKPAALTLQFVEHLQKAIQDSIKYTDEHSKV